MALLEVLDDFVEVCVPDGQIVDEHLIVRLGLCGGQCCQYVVAALLLCRMEPEHAILHLDLSVVIKVRRVPVHILATLEHL